MLATAGIRGTYGQFTSGVSLVEVYATVTDKTGEPVTGLTAADFEVEEDGAPQRITAFGAGDMPLSVAIALDRSFSMGGQRLALAKRAAATFIAALRAQDEVTVLAVGSEIETITPPVSAADAERTRWEAIDAWGTTPLYDVAMRALDVIQQRRGRRALLLLSDGADRGSDTPAATLIEHARRSDVLVYPVAINKTRPAVFAELAAVSGGRSVLAADAPKLDAAMTSIARELRFQYLLGYVPTRQPDAAPAWHAIEVHLARRAGRDVRDVPDVRVRARDGYYGR